MKSIILPAAFLLSSLCAPAINIVVSYDPDHANARVHASDDGSDPAYPKAGDKLMLIANAAAEYWEGIIKDPGTLTLKFHYEPLAAPNIGHWTQKTTTFVPDPNPALPPIEGRNLTGEIEIHDTLSWFYDLTPNDHSEYVFTSTLNRDLSVQDRSNFSGSPPPTFEAFHVGTPAPGAPAAATTNSDLYSIVLHEIGHALGMTTQLDAAELETQDGQLNFDPMHLNGATCGLNTNPVRKLHPVCPGCLMNSGIGPGLRRLPSATDVLALAICPLPNYSQIDIPRKDFLPGGSGSWHTAGNWVGKRLPDSQDDTFVRLSNSGGVFGVTPFPVSLAGSVRVENVTVGDFSVVSTGANRLKADSTVNILHDGDPFDFPAIQVDSGGELESRDVSLQGGVLTLRGGLVDIDRELEIGTTPAGRRSTLRGFGTVDVTDHVSGTINVSGKLINNGSIVATDDGTLTLQSTGAEIWDLDGTIGSGELVAVEGNIAITGGALTTAFEGRMTIGEGRSITITEDWTILGDNAELTLDGGGSPATLGGAGALEFIRGGIDVNGTSRIATQIALHEDSNVDVAGGASLSFGGDTEISGGSYTGNGRLRFDNALTIEADTTFDVDLLDLDGNAGNTVINLNEALTINASELDSGNSRFDGTLNLNSIFGSLSVEGPSSWAMDGQMNVTGSSVFQFPMLSGAPLEISGTANVSKRSAWSARTTISGSVQMTSDPTDRLVLLGGSQAEPNRLENGGVGLFGTLELSNNAWLSGWGLISSATQVNPGGGLLADDGTLILARAPGLSSNTTLGTADSDATLQVNPDWTLPAGAELTLAGGSVTGGELDNLSLVSGFGSLAIDQLINAGEIRATGDGTLEIDTSSKPDLDGTGTGRLQAVDGNLTIMAAVTDPFGGLAEIGPGRTMTFQAGWTLDSTGTLELTGSEGVPSSPAQLAGSNIVLEGDVQVSGPAAISASRFAMGADIDLASGASVTMTSPTTIEPGATFADGGGAQFVTSHALVLLNSSSLDVPSTLRGPISLGAGSSVATASLRTPDFQNSTSLKIDISGTPSSGSRDLLMIDGEAALDGTLQLSFSASGLAVGDTWKIVAGTSLRGRFDNILATGLPAGLEPRAYILPDGAYVKLVQQFTFSDWTSFHGLPSGQDEFGDDPDFDGIPNGFEAFVGSNPLDSADAVRVQIGSVQLGGVEYLSISVSRNVHTDVTGLSLDFWRSEDLITWTNNDTGSLPAAFDPLTCLQTFTFFSKIPISDAERQFLRLEVSRP